MRTRLLLLLGATAALVFASFVGAGTSSAADHGDAPLSKANHAEDLADVYAFKGAQGDTVFVMTVNPLTMPSDKPTFDQQGLYQFRIDNNGDAVPDVTYDVTFGAVAADGSQDVSVQRATGSDADALSAGGSVLISGKTTPGTADPVVNKKNGAMLFAGLRDDPFFFDLNAFKAGLKFRNPGNDFFQGLNVSAIVLEVPSSNFLASGSTMAGVWAVTSKNGGVIDRMGRPAINTVFVPAEMKDQFNNTKPASDVSSWKSTFVATLNTLGSDPKLADALLPDILTFDTSKAMNFLNGRALTDDVIDAELQLITGNPAASDNVLNDSTFLSNFPFVGAPNTSPAPTPVAIAPAAAPSNAAATAPMKPSGVVAPNTGTGDATGGDSGMWLWLAAGLAGMALAFGSGAVLVHRRGK